MSGVDGAFLAGAATAAWLMGGAVVAAALEGRTRHRSGPLVIAFWPLALAGYTLLCVTLWVLRRLDHPDPPIVDPPPRPGLRDDGGWLSPEEALLRARAECEEAGHAAVDVTCDETWPAPVRRWCGRCGESLPMDADAP